MLRIGGFGGDGHQPVVNFHFPYLLNAIFELLLLSDVIMLLILVNTLNRFHLLSDYVYAVIFVILMLLIPYMPIKRGRIDWH